MGTCNKCKFGELCIDWNGANTYWWCTVTNECVEREIAEDENYECDLYVQNSNDDTSEKA